MGGNVDRSDWDVRSEREKKYSDIFSPENWTEWQVNVQLDGPPFWKIEAPTFLRFVNCSVFHFIFYKLRENERNTFLFRRCSLRVQCHVWSPDVATGLWVGSSLLLYRREMFTAGAASRYLLTFGTSTFCYLQFLLFFYLDRKLSDRSLVKVSGNNFLIKSLINISRCNFHLHNNSHFK